MLKKIDLSLKGLGPSEIAALAKLFRRNISPELYTLKLGYNDLGDEGAKVIATHLENDEHIRCLDLCFNGIGDEGVNHLANSLLKNTTLEVLYLSGNKICHRGFEYLAEALLQNRHITLLQVAGNSANAKGLEALAMSLRHNFAVHTLNVSGNNTGWEGVDFLRDTLAINHSIVELQLSDNNVGDKGLNLLSSALQHHRSMKILDLSFNKVTNQGMESFCSVLREYTSLKRLKIDNNQIGDKGATLLACALATMELSFLDVGFNFISTDGVILLIRSLTPNRHLQGLVLSGNSMNAAATVTMAEMLKVDSVLKELYLDRITLGPVGEKNIAVGIATNSVSTLSKLTGFHLGKALLLLGAPDHLAESSNEATLNYLVSLWAAQAVQMAQAASHATTIIPAPEIASDVKSAAASGDQHFRDTSRDKSLVPVCAAAAAGAASGDGKIEVNSLFINTANNQHFDPSSVHSVMDEVLSDFFEQSMLEPWSPVVSPSSISEATTASFTAHAQDVAGNRLCDSAVSATSITAAAAESPAGSNVPPLSLSSVLLRNGLGDQVDYTAYPNGVMDGQSAAMTDTTRADEITLVDSLYGPASKRRFFAGSSDLASVPSEDSGDNFPPAPSLRRKDRNALDGQNTPAFHKIDTLPFSSSTTSKSSSGVGIIEAAAPNTSTFTSSGSGDIAAESASDTISTASVIVSSGKKAAVRESSPAVVRTWEQLRDSLNALDSGNSTAYFSSCMSAARSIADSPFDSADFNELYNYYFTPPELPSSAMKRDDVTLNDDNNSLEDNTVSEEGKMGTVGVLSDTDTESTDISPHMKRKRKQRVNRTAVEMGTHFTLGSHLAQSPIPSLSPLSPRKSPRLDRSEFSPRLSLSPRFYDDDSEHEGTKQSQSDRLSNDRLTTPRIVSYPRIQVLLGNLHGLSNSMRTLAVLRQLRFLEESCRGKRFDATPADIEELLLQCLHS